MAYKMRWVETTGGPHILAPVEGLAQWRGAKGWRDNIPDDDSDYVRACRVTGWLGKISSQAGLDLIVLSGDVGAIAWFPHANGESGVIVQWLGCDSDDAIFSLLNDRDAIPQKARLYEETLDFDTGPSGVLTAFDSTVAGDDAISNGTTIRLRPGRYEILASYIEREDCMVVLREVRAKL